MPHYAVLIRECVRLYGGSKTDYAKAAGISSSVLSRILSAKHVPSTDLCLRLAACCGMPPSLLLQAAGHGETALLIERLYGQPKVTQAPAHTNGQPSGAEYALLESWRTLDSGEAK